MVRITWMTIGHYTPAGSPDVFFIIAHFSSSLNLLTQEYKKGRILSRNPMNKWQETVIAKEPFGTLKTPLTKRFVHLIAPRPFTHPSRDSGLLLDCRHQ
jgi:hypothetical protein